MTAPWIAAEVDPDRVVAELAKRFPGISAWLGEFTGHWWAVALDRMGSSQLVEAATPAALAKRLDEIGARQFSPPSAPTYARRPAAAPVQAPPRPVRPAAPSRSAAARHEHRRRAGWFRSMICALTSA
ncbi:hypothetical protein [Actinomadura chokoriensis]|uniref:hypothetical protein n=1 Tax=Actinomadura chokoriensis TaxID=454156 RepID=UPI0031F89824